MATMNWERLRETSEFRDLSRRFILTPEGNGQLALRDLRIDPDKTKPPLALGTLKFCKDKAQALATEEGATEQLSSKRAETRDADDKPTGFAAEQFLPKAAAAEQQESEHDEDDDDEEEDERPAPKKKAPAKKKAKK